ncbi:hypothetical protein PLESTB_001770700 [Pleodorina starrii]|uniref:Uncharacterized protein n=1 Tax=Pleodorina starrii TaxID=330485 RepID=A0A9W6C146_9CHLO|nr:hypothetical protein PLESTB_001770700 [Pleodorina starrii]
MGVCVQASSRVAHKEAGRIQKAGLRIRYCFRALGGEALIGSWKKRRVWAFRNGGGCPCLRAHACARACMRRLCPCLMTRHVCLIVCSFVCVYVPYAVCSRPGALVWRYWTGRCGGREAPSSVRAGCAGSKSACLWLIAAGACTCVWMWMCGGCVLRCACWRCAPKGATPAQGPTSFKNEWFMRLTFPALIPNPNPRIATDSVAADGIDSPDPNSFDPGWLWSPHVPTRGAGAGGQCELWVLAGWLVGCSVGWLVLVYRAGAATTNTRPPWRDMLLLLFHDDDAVLLVLFVHLAGGGVAAVRLTVPSSSVWRASDVPRGGGWGWWRGAHRERLRCPPAPVCHQRRPERERRLECTLSCCLALLRVPPGVASVPACVCGGWGTWAEGNGGPCMCACVFFRLGFRFLL